LICSKRQVDPGQRKTRTEKYSIPAILFMIAVLCISTVFVAPSLAQMSPQDLQCSVKFDKSSYMPGETVTIHGTVTYKGEPVKGVRVAVDINDFGLTGLEAVTDSNGNWTLSFEVPEDQKFGTRLAEVTVEYEGVKMMEVHRLYVGEEVDEVEVLRAQIAELNAEKMGLEAKIQGLQDRIRELEAENQRLREASSGVSFGTLAAVAVVLGVVFCLAVFVTIYKRRSQRQSSEVIELCQLSSM